MPKELSSMRLRCYLSTIRYVLHGATFQKIVKLNIILESQRVFQIFSYQFLDSPPVTQPPIQMKPGMSCVAHCDICDSWCQAQEQQNTLTTDGSGRRCTVKGRKFQCDKDRAPCGGTLGHLCRCQTKCPP